MFNRCLTTVQVSGHSAIGLLLAYSIVGLDNLGILRVCYEVFSIKMVKILKPDKIFGHSHSKLVFNLKIGSEMREHHFLKIDISLISLKPKS